MSVREIHCAGIMLIRKPEVSSTNTNFRLDLLFLEDARGEFTIPKGRIGLNETEFVSAQRITQEATGFGPEDYDVFQQFGFVIDDPHCKKVIYWVGIIKNPAQPVRLATEYMNLFWMDIGLFDSMGMTMMGKMSSGMDKTITTLVDNHKSLERAIRNRK